jgi:hypothetical protein
MAPRKPQPASPKPPASFGKGGHSAERSPVGPDSQFRYPTLFGFGVDVYLSAALLTIRWNEPPCTFQVPPDRVINSKITPFSDGIWLTLEVRLGPGDSQPWSHATVWLPFPAHTGDHLAYLRHVLGHDPVPQSLPTGAPVPSAPSVRPDVGVTSQKLPAFTPPPTSESPSAPALWIEPCVPADAGEDPEWLRLRIPTETQRLLRPADEELTT